MHDGSYDALIIGGGPGGSTTATYLAKAGKRVLVLEKETFPRFHIGESLLPYNRAIFEEMGRFPTQTRSTISSRQRAALGRFCVSPGQIHS
jgi:flavin-dependent dehydrogenase